MTRALITRPLEDAATLAEALRRRGIEPVIEPLLTVTPLPAALPSLDGVRALLFSSANGVRAFTQASERRDLAAFAVGPATATAACAAGFTTVETADGDSDALARLVGERLKPDDGPLIHIAGRAVAGDLVGQLRARGFAIERIALYDAVPAEALSPAVAQDLGAGRIDAVLLFSPRTAATFARLVDAAGRADALKACTALCLSQPVAETVARLPWKQVRVAAKPDQDSLLALLDAPKTAVAPAPPAARSRTPIVPAIVASVVTVAVLVGALAASAPLWRDWLLPPTPAPAPPPAGASPQRLAEVERSLDQRIATLSRELDALRVAVANAPPDAASGADKQAVADLDARLGKLADQLASVQQHASDAEAAQQQRASDTARGSAFALGVAELEDAARGGHPFAANLATLRKLAPDPATAALLAPLEPLAAQGVPTLAQLKRDWPEAARRATAAQVGADYGGWLGTVMARLASLVTIRRVGADVAGDDTEALLARAGARLDGDDLAGAVALVERLPEPAARAVAPWLERARTRLTAEAALGRLVEQALAGAPGKG